MAKKTPQPTQPAAQPATTPALTSLGLLVSNDLVQFMSNLKRIFTCEADFQLELANYLRSTKHYQNVFLEYLVPNNTLPTNVWNQDMYIDIVVEKDGKFVPIELKYRTRAIQQNYLCFGKCLPNVQLLRTQYAINIATYNYWKDVRRLELAKSSFPNIVAGFAILLTNDMLYLSNRTPGSISAQMSTATGLHNRSRQWQGNVSPKTLKSHPNFMLNNCYNIEWKQCLISNIDFHYCMLTI